MARTIDADEARYLNKKVGGLYGIYHAGSSIEGWKTERDIIIAAKAQWRKLFPKAKYLVLGNPVYCGPKRILASTRKGVIRQLNKYWREFEKLDRRNMGDAVSEKYFALLNGE